MRRIGIQLYFNTPLFKEYCVEYSLIDLFNYLINYAGFYFITVTE